MTILGILSVFGALAPPSPHPALFAISVICTVPIAIAGMIFGHDALRGHNAFISQGNGYIAYGVGQNGLKIIPHDVKESRDDSVFPLGIDVIMQDGRVYVLAGALAKGGRRAIRWARVDSGCKIG